MPFIKYEEHRFSSGTKKIIEKANEIIREYSAQGFELTLRQLYYQFVSRDLLANNQKEYKRLGSVINDARMAGLIDWNAIVDRTRNLNALSHWDSVAEIVSGCALQYREDLWKDQPHRIEVWIEKDALVGVIEGVCNEHDVPFFSCRGYTSQSEMWAAAMRLDGYKESGQEPVIIHLGDHDPSGKDMTRDIGARFDTFMGGLNVMRVALNIDQIKKYAPPPNPCKLTDVRAKAYMREFGSKSWELDALNPPVIAALIKKTILSLRDKKLWDAAVIAQNEGREKLNEIANNL